MKQLLTRVAFALVAGMSSLAMAQAGEHAGQTAATDAASTAALTDGEVRKVDKDAKKITIRHAAIANLDMPPMTMVFQVSDPAVLERVKAGDKVRFAVEKREGAFTVIRIETAS